MPAPDILALLSGSSWNAGSGAPTVITYSFAQDGLSSFGRVLPNTAWQAFSTTQQASTRQALQEWQDVSGIDFVEVPDTAAGDGVDLRFRLEDLGGIGVTGQAEAPGYGGIALNLKLFRTDGLAPSPTRIGFFTLLHEIGHGLGLKHPWEGSATLPGAEDTNDYTVMAYTRGANGLPNAPQSLDIAAVQDLYGTPGDRAALGLTWSYDTAWQAVRGTGTAGDDLLTAPAHGSVLDGAGGNDTLLGGAGQDTAVVHADRADALVDTAAGTVATAGGTLHLSGIEALAFNDGRLVIGADDPVALVWRIYQVALDRTPDDPGLLDWVGVIFHGWKMHDVATGFVNSPEFIRRFGVLDDAGYAKLLVKHAGGGDATALEAALAAGTDRQQLLLDVVDGEAARTKVAPLLVQGLWLPDVQGAEVARLHQLAYGTLPFEPEWRVNLEQLMAGDTVAEVADTIAQGSHFRKLHGSESASQLLPELLHNGLGRDATADELAGWQQRLASDHLDVPGLLVALDQDSAVQAHLMPTTEPAIAFL